MKTERAICVLMDVLFLLLPCLGGNIPPGLSTGLPHSQGTSAVPHLCYWIGTPYFMDTADSPVAYFSVLLGKASFVLLLFHISIYGRVNF